MKTNEKGAKPRILILNDYLDGREALAEAGEYPRSHLWGMKGLQEAGFRVHLISKRKCHWIDRLTRRFHVNVLGSVGTQLEVLRASGDSDAIYVVTGSYPILRLLRKCRMLKKPVFIWAYSPFSSRPRRKYEKFIPPFLRLGGFDGYLCLTRKTETSFRREYPGLHIRHVRWGADTEMFKPVERTDDTELYAFACGRSGRDFPTLFATDAYLNGRMKVICPQSERPDGQVERWIQILKGPNDTGTDQGMPYSELIRLQQNAVCHVICLKKDPDSCAGFTNLLEAMAVGRPVVMTQTGCLDIDIEKEGVGIYVRPHDPESLAQAINHLIRNPNEASRMGARGRKFAEERYSLSVLDQGVANYFCDYFAPGTATSKIS